MFSGVTVSFCVTLISLFTQRHVNVSVDLTKHRFSFFTLSYPPAMVHSLTFKLMGFGVESEVQILLFIAVCIRRSFLCLVPVSASI